MTTAQKANSTNQPVVVETNEQFDDRVLRRWFPGRKKPGSVVFAFLSSIIKTLL